LSDIKQLSPLVAEFVISTIKEYLLANLLILQSPLTPTQTLIDRVMQFLDYLVNLAALRANATFREMLKKNENGTHPWMLACKPKLREAWLPGAAPLVCLNYPAAISADRSSARNAR
jgi:hypothetical protein